MGLFQPNQKVPQELSEIKMRFAQMATSLTGEKFLKRHNNCNMSPNFVAWKSSVQI